MTTTFPVTEPRMIDVRLLGALRVRRSDGSMVAPSAWRTGKTADLLRLLAVHDGQPVTVERLLSVLWPDVDQRRGRASLRTATCRVRQVLGADHVVRTPNGLSLVGVTSDLVRFRALVVDIGAATRAGDAGGVLALAGDALELAQEELSASDYFADWAVTERRLVANDHLWLLGVAAAAALENGYDSGAHVWARRLTTLDPFSELGCRLLMRACAAEGETSAAVREYARYRQLVNTELGTDPSPQTSELHVRLLRGELVTPRTDVEVQRRTFPATAVPGHRLPALITI